MKAALISFLVMLILCAVVPGRASAQQLVLYDNFEAAVLNPAGWIGAESSGTGVNILEARRQIKNEPIFDPNKGPNKALNIFLRSYAATGSDNGRLSSSDRLIFSDGRLKTIRARVLVKRVEGAPCATNTKSVTEPRVRIGGQYFNTGTPVPGDATNDIQAFIIVGKPSDATDLAADELKIYGKVNLCNNEDCTDSTELGSQDIGTVRVNNIVKLRITWDPDNNRFVFQKGKAAEVVIPYAEPVGGEPGSSHGGNKRLEVHLLLPNCTSSQPMASLEASFDDIMIER
jgi:hypothetical protein